MIDLSKLLKTVMVLTLGALLVMLSGCASRMTIAVRDGLKVPESADSGLLVVSMGRSRQEASWPPHQVHMIGFRKRGGSDDEQGWLHSILSEPKPESMDIANDDLVLMVMTIRLPPGEYEISSGSMSTDTGTYYSSISSRDGVSMPFRIEPNKATYIGRFVAIGVKAGKNFFGQELNTGVYVIENRMDQDLQLLLKREPGALDGLTTTQAVPAFEGVQGGMFVTKGIGP